MHKTTIRDPRHNVTADMIQRATVLHGWGHWSQLGLLRTREASDLRDLAVPTVPTKVREAPSAHEAGQVHCDRPVLAAGALRSMGPG